MGYDRVAVLLREDAEIRGERGGGGVLLLVVHILLHTKKQSSQPSSLFSRSDPRQYTLTLFGDVHLNLNAKL
jgi:hypothetical protein